LRDGHLAQISCEKLTKQDFRDSLGANQPIAEKRSVFDYETGAIVTINFTDEDGRAPVVNLPLGDHIVDSNKSKPI
jgi:hypothetical protein